MRRLFSGRLGVMLAVLALVWVAVPATRSFAKDNPEKHARKIEKKITHYKPGTLLRVVLTNGNESQGALTKFDEQGFTLTNSETNASETHQYGEVDSVGKGSNAIGKGSGARHHRFPL
jgi:hypothetical protein